VANWRFSPGTLISPANKTDRQEIAEILLKVVLNAITHRYLKKHPKKQHSAKLVN